MWRHRRQQEEVKRRYDQWIESLERDCPAVLVGGLPVADGVREHILAISRYSDLKVGIAPPPALSSVGLANRIQPFLKDDFGTFSAGGIGATHSHVYPWYIEWCARQRDLNQVPWVHTYHNKYYPESGENGELLPWQRDFNRAAFDIASKADIRLSVSRWQVDELLDEEGISARYLPNGVSVEALDRARPSRFPRKHGKRDFTLFVGRDDPVKNPDEFIQLARRHPQYHFVMIGGGLDADFTAASGSIPSNVLMLGARSHAEVIDAIAACRMLVVTSKREGLPTLVLEALGLSKPVIVPDEKGCVEAIEGGAFGRVYQPGDLEDLSVAFSEALAGPRINEGARERIEDEYSWSVVAPQLDDVYRELLQ